MIEEENFDEEDMTLLAIGIFILKNKSPWGKGNIRVKVAAGGVQNMEDLLTPEGRTCCIDGSAIAKTIAERYGISGEIRAPRLHGSFETESGKVLDAFYGHARGGVFRTKSQYDEFVKNMKLKDRLGTDLDFILGRIEE